MISFPRSMAQQFRAAVARCSPARARAPAPPVVIRRSNGRVTLTATFPEITLELACPTTVRGDEVLVTPMSAIESVQGSSTDVVEIHVERGNQGLARWTDRGTPKSIPIELIVPGKHHAPLLRPQHSGTVPGRFLWALHEATQTASRDDGRYALSMVQIRGKSGEIVATDSRVALIVGGFHFPFPDDALIPATSLYGHPELMSETLSIGRTDAHLVVTSGPWTVWLTMVLNRRFPDVASIVPRNAPTAVGIDSTDSEELIEILPKLPGNADEFRPVTLDVDRSLVVRGEDSETHHASEVSLSRCPVSGPPVRVALDRRALSRFLALGCHTLRLGSDKPVVLAEGEGFLILSTTLDSSLVTRKEVTRTPMDSRPPTPERRVNVRSTNGNGHAPPGRSSPPPPNPPLEPPAEPNAPDPLVEAEELRLALSDAMNKVTRLIAVLKSGRKEKKVLAGVWAGLKQLNFHNR